jgi:hypothetical protein
LIKGYGEYWLRSFSEILGKDIGEEFKRIENSLKRKD